MKKTNLVIISLLIPLFLNSCGTIAEGLGGGKKKFWDPPQKIFGKKFVGKKNFEKKILKEKKF